MAIEFEAKVLITAEEFINIMTEKNLGFSAFSLYKKEDEYWSRYSSKSCVFSYSGVKITKPVKCDIIFIV